MVPACPGWVLGIGYWVLGNWGIGELGDKGNNLQIINYNLLSWYATETQTPITNSQNPGFLYRNNAPTVSDIVYLKKGEGVEIWMFQDTAGPIQLDTQTPNSEKNYVSIHKIS